MLLIPDKVCQTVEHIKHLQAANKKTKKTIRSVMGMFFIKPEKNNSYVPKPSNATKPNK